MTPIETCTIIFGCVFAGALIGMWLRSVLPKHHLGDDTKDLMKLGVGLIGTMSALVLGLLVASAESSYSTQSTELTQMAANVILLDRMLAHYGPEADDARATLKIAVARNLDQIWPKGGVEPSPSASRPNNDIMFDKLQELTPHSRESADASGAGRIDRYLAGPDALAALRAERNDSLNPISRSGGLLAEYSFHELRLVRTAECDCCHDTDSQCDIGCGSDLSDSRARTSIHRIGADPGDAATHCTPGDRQITSLLPMRSAKKCACAFEQRAKLKLDGGRWSQNPQGN